jgi:chromosome segregation ATPase
MASMVRRPTASAAAARTTTTTSGLTAPEAGIIKSVYVENFMCHKKLTVDLCRNVNFIHGQNGSGKSAILAAVQICLGAGARRTHRARNLKDLVRKDASAAVTHAKVRVTLWNQGTDAYQHEVYGDQITVERIISIRAGGYNGYKLLDHTGVERTRLKKDLDDMLDQLNIQVENPVAVLDQEDAKRFLTGKPQDKYNFFMKATELERMDRQYGAISDKLLQMADTKQKVEAGLSEMADKVKKLKKQWEQHQEVEKLEEKLAELNVLYSWAFYNDFEQQHEQMQEVCSNDDDEHVCVCVCINIYCELWFQSTNHTCICLLFFTNVIHTYRHWLKSWPNWKKTICNCPKSRPLKN